MCCCDFVKRLVVFAIFLNQIHCSDRFDCKFEKLDNEDFPKIIQLAECQGNVVEIKLEHDDVKDFVKNRVDIPFVLRSRCFYNCDINEVVKKCLRKLIEKGLGVNFVLRFDFYFLLKNGTQEDIGDNYKGEIDDTNFATFYFVPADLSLFDSDLIFFYYRGDAYNLRIFDKNKGYRIYFCGDLGFKFKCISFSAVTRAEKIFKGPVLEDKIEEIKANKFKIDNKVPPILSQPSKYRTVPFEKKKQLGNIYKHNMKELKTVEGPKNIDHKSISRVHSDATLHVPRTQGSNSGKSSGSGVKTNVGVRCSCR